MTMRNALRISKGLAIDATVSAHYGANKRTDRAVRIYNCLTDTATDLARRIAEAIPGSTPRVSAGFVCVWL